MAAKARARNTRPSPAPLASSGGLADAILRATIDTGDHIGSGFYSPTVAIGSDSPYPRPLPHGREGKRHFIMVELSEALFRHLCLHGAKFEDDEPDADDEPNGGRPRAA